jgi:hypothetical protein
MSARSRLVTPTPEPAYQRAKPDQTGGRHAERVRHVDRAQIRTRSGELREAGVRRERAVRDREAAQTRADSGGGGDEHRVEELCEMK